MGGETPFCKKNMVWTPLWIDGRIIDVEVAVSYEMLCFEAEYFDEVFEGVCAVPTMLIHGI